MVVGGMVGLKEHEEALEVEERNKVRRFVDKRMKRKKRLVERDLVL